MIVDRVDDIQLKKSLSLSFPTSLKQGGETRAHTHGGFLEDEKQKDMHWALSSLGAVSLHIHSHNTHTQMA